MAASCAAPTLPLPPPAALVYSAPDADGIVTVSGEALPNALVTCLNVNKHEGRIVYADDAGDFTVRIPADVGDELQVWQESGTDEGPRVTIFVLAQDAGPDAGFPDAGVPDVGFPN